MTEGQHVFGRWSSNLTIYFLLLPSSLYNMFKRGRNPNALISQSGLNGEIDFTAPKADTYYFIFENTVYHWAHIHFELVSVTSATVTSTLYSTVAQTYAALWTQTITQTTTQGVAESALGPSSLLLIVVVIAAIALGAFFLLRTRSKQKGVGAKVQLCANCGAQLAPNAKFCKKCGKSTSKG